MVLFECSNWYSSALPNFMESVTSAKNHGNEMQVIGILRTLNDLEEVMLSAFNEMITEDYLMKFLKRLLQK